MSHWNYRIMRQTHPDGSITYAIHEVYYNEDTISGWTDNPVAPIHSSDPTLDMDITEQEMLRCLKDQFDLMSEAFTKPTLDYNNPTKE